MSSDGLKFNLSKIGQDVCYLKDFAQVNIDI